MNPPPKFFTLGEIEGLRGIKSPHEKELDDIKARGLPNLQNISTTQLHALVSELGGMIVPLDLGEAWAFTKAMFPGVHVHVGLRQYDDEFGTGATSELLILFSGDAVRFVPGEDLASYVELLVEYADVLVERHPSRPINDASPSPMLIKASRERAVALPLLCPKDTEPLQAFVGAVVHIGNGVALTFSPFPGIIVEVHWAPPRDPQVTFSGDHSPRMSIFDLERVAILSLNHVLRYILIKNGAETSPRICHQMFTPFGREKYRIAPIK